MDTLKRIEKIIRESAFDNKKKEAGLKFNPGLVLTGVRITGPWTDNASSSLLVFSHDVTAAILVSQNNEMAAMLVSQTNPVGVELFSYANAFFCSNKFA